MLLVLRFNCLTAGRKSEATPHVLLELMCIYESPRVIALSVVEKLVRPVQHFLHVADSDRKVLHNTRLCISHCVNIITSGVLFSLKTFCRDSQMREAFILSVSNKGSRLKVSVYGSWSGNRRVIIIRW